MTTQAFLDALGIGNGVADWRALHDVIKGAPPRVYRGTFAEVEPALRLDNAAGYGIFVTLNEMDGNGLSYPNITRLRAHVIDTDDDDPATWYRYAALQSWTLPPSFYVFTRPGRHHAYWRLADNTPVNVDKFQELQRKLATLFHSDGAVIDASRAPRVPGFNNMKNPSAPVLVTYLAGNGKVYEQGQLEWQLAGVVANAGGGETRELTDGRFAAPSWEWAIYALNKIDPGTLNRLDWLKVTAAYKASTSTLVDEASARAHWDAWCATYGDNDLAENNKLWKDIRRSKTGWAHLKKVSGVAGELAFGLQTHTAPALAGPGAPVGVAVPPVASAPVQPLDMGFMLMPAEQAEYFKGCTYIERMGEMLVPSGRFFNTGQFNASYGGKVFVISADSSKTTDEPWKAATRGQVFRVRKVDNIRFLPAEAPGAILTDELGREAINTYRPAVVRYERGDATPWLRHIRAILATDQDYEILINYLRHIVQRPGVKVPWAPLIQSSEGAGKGLIKEAMAYAVGGVYFYSPNTKELAEAGAKFNVWLRSKILIVADEIRVDEKRDMMDVLRPIISEARIEIQSKGIDQEFEDNVSNWIFFTNFKDALPIGANDRRYAIFYSTIQSIEDIERLGMSGDYFPKMYAWLRSGGNAYVAEYLASSAITPALDPAGLAHRAPHTSSHAEAVYASLGLLEQTIAEAVDMELAGFKGGWISSAAVERLLEVKKLKYGPHAKARAFTALGYKRVSRAARVYFEEGGVQPYLYRKDDSDIGAINYGPAQGYAS